jgi:hypothetical protein
MIAFACYLSPCNALDLRCTGDPLDQGRPFHKTKSTVIDCVKSSELDKLDSRLMAGSHGFGKGLRENRRENRRSAKAGKSGSRPVASGRVG